MPDNLTPEDRRKAMRAVKGKYTSLERQLFAMLAGMRLKGWKKHAEELPGKPDVVFSKEHLIIFADGCFWHGCPECNKKLPTTNREYWKKKIERNIERDRQNTQNLTDQGWCVLRIWEHELRDAEGRAKVRAKIQKVLSKALSPG